MFMRRLGRSNLEVSAIGLGCWAIGGPWDWLEDDGSKNTDGLGQVDDAESIRAIHYALNAGINFFDTAANYGCGHSERILARAVKGWRDNVMLATKFGYFVDEQKLTVTEPKDVISRIRQECESSLRNLQTDYIDLYQFHKGDYPSDKVVEVCDVLETLVDEGKVRWYGWSTDNVEGTRVFAQGEHCAAIQHRLNMKDYYPKMLAVCDEYDLASINRSPLVSGFLTGKFNSKTTFPKDDVRSTWNLQDERTIHALQQVDAARKYFAEIGEVRTLTQIALAWLWTCNERTIPIPGFRTVAQVKENIQAIEFGLLSKEYMKKIDEFFERSPVTS